MRRASTPTRDRILQAAYNLFYEKGFSRVGVDAVAEAAGLTKRTLYQHFRSKDDLLAAVLDRQSGFALASIESWGERLPEDCSGFVQQLFRDAARWASSPKWAGAGFTRLAMELADLPGHPARAVARRHKAAIEAWLCAELARRGVRGAEEAGRELTVLMEGCLALILIHGKHDYALAAGRAASKLTSGEGGPSAEELSINRVPSCRAASAKGPASSETSRSRRKQST